MGSVERTEDLYQRWLRCWMKTEEDPLFLRDALCAAYARGRADALEQAAEVAGSYSGHAICPAIARYIRALGTATGGDK